MQQEVFDRSRQVADQPFSQYGGPTVAGADPMSQIGAQGMLSGMGNYSNIYNQAMNFSGAPNMSFGSNLATGRKFDSGLDPNQKFTNFNTNPYEQAGQTGLSALTGNQAATDQLMNPYIKNVVDAMSGQYDRLRDKSVMDVNDIATKGGAFGGDRQALLQGERLGAIDQAQASDISNLLHSGFNDAMGRASSAANLGLGSGQLDLGQGQLGANYRLGVGDQSLRGQELGANWDQALDARGLQAQGMNADYQLGRSGQQLSALGAAGQAAAGGLAASQGVFGAGDYNRQIQQQQYDDAQRRFNEQRDWGLRGLNIMSGSMSGQPYGQTSSTPLTKNVGAGILGGAATGAKIGGPWGALAGGILGAF